jgi:hypothetical protein
MSRTTIADPSLIHGIEAFKERVAIHIHEGGIPTDQARTLQREPRASVIRRTTGPGLGSM